MRNLTFLAVVLAFVRCAPAHAVHAPGETLRDCAVCPDMTVIPGGSFLMGSPEDEEGRRSNEGPVHRVTISSPFAAGRTEVTRRQFAAFVEATGYRTEDGCLTDEDGPRWRVRAGRTWRDPGYRQTDSHPAVCVNWHDARAYARWLTERTGKPYRLLTEAEWEYAARAGSTGRFSNEGGAQRLCDIANWAGRLQDGSEPCRDGYPDTTAPAGSFAANQFGLHDMHGNVWEWVEDAWCDDYTDAPADGSARARGCGSVATPAGKEIDDARVIRGGGFKAAAAFVRSAVRSWSRAGQRHINVGFRVARELD